MHEYAVKVEWKRQRSFDKLRMTNGELAKKRRYKSRRLRDTARWIVEAREIAMPMAERAEMMLAEKAWATCSRLPDSR